MKRAPMIIARNGDKIVFSGDPIRDPMRGKKLTQVDLNLTLESHKDIELLRELLMLIEPCLPVTFTSHTHTPLNYISDKEEIREWFNRINPTPYEPSH